ncbi:MAG: hypothetical protein Q9M30_08840 [Mariprofundaceae bacterium]|nr:hypothetical protein [Mariprofundaceae bacterium]
MIKRLACVLGLLCSMTGPLDISPAFAGASDAYRQAIALAAQGRDAEAIAMLAGAGAMAPEVWRDRMQAAAGLLGMRRERAGVLSPTDSLHAALLAAYSRQHAPPVAANAQLVGVIATVFPGAGHARLGRWHDAGIAALMVWPLLLLTFWAWRRGMGPVTVFFALLTLWLWSGTVFSAISLSERGAYEAYAIWWHGLWQASGLPGRPW